MPRWSSAGSGIEQGRCSQGAEQWDFPSGPLNKQLSLRGSHSGQHFALTGSSQTTAELMLRGEWICSQKWQPHRLLDCSSPCLRLLFPLW